MRSLLTFIVISSAWAQTGAPDPPVLTVGQEKITASQFERMIRFLPQATREMAKTAEGRRHLADQVAQVIALAQEARERKLDHSLVAQERIALETDEVLASELYKLLETPSDHALQAYYDEHAGDFEEVTARQILIRFHGSVVPLREGHKDLTEAEALRKAKRLRAQIWAGAAFGNVAKSESDDESCVHGGELGTFRRGKMVKQIEEAAFSLPVGGLSEPVRSPLGYHLLLIEGRHRMPFEQVRNEIDARIVKDVADRAISDIKSKAGIHINGEYFTK